LKRKKSLKTESIQVYAQIKNRQKRGQKTRCKNKAATSETETEPLPTPKKEEETLKKEALEKEEEK
jgi:hypothetical protein